MSVWVKICGNTSLQDALIAAEAGADAVGFVFATSPRRVTTGLVAAITPKLPDSLEKVGVFADTTVRVCRLSGVQLHSQFAHDLPETLRASFGPALRILQVEHYGFNDPVHAVNLLPNRHIDAVLLDSRTSTAIGGTGVVFDWAEAARTLFQTPNGRNVRLVVAGGLTPDNVTEAIEMLHPWGVDVVSGVEAAPGRKDPDKVRRFVENARAAARRG
jgi:phosphoribosylanthranilate isomerase